MDFENVEHSNSSLGKNGMILPSNDVPIIDSRQADAIMPVWLVVEPSSDAAFNTRRLLLGETKIKIGRAHNKVAAQDNNAIFQNRVLSRNHAEVWREHGKVWIRDLGSSNGTLLNGIQLHSAAANENSAEIQTGDIIQLGDDMIEASGEISYRCIRAKVILLDESGTTILRSQNEISGNTEIEVVGQTEAGRAATCDRLEQLEAQITEMNGILGGQVEATAAKEKDSRERLKEVCGELVQCMSEARATSMQLLELMEALSTLEKGEPPGLKGLSRQQKETLCSIALGSLQNSPQLQQAQERAERLRAEVQGLTEEAERGTAMANVAAEELASITATNQALANQLRETQAQVQAEMSKKAQLDETNRLVVERRAEVQRLEALLNEAHTQAYKNTDKLVTERMTALEAKVDPGTESANQSNQQRNIMPSSSSSSAAAADSGMIGNKSPGVAKDLPSKVAMAAMSPATSPEKKLHGHTPQGTQTPKAAPKSRGLRGFSAIGGRLLSSPSWSKNKSPPPTHGSQQGNTRSRNGTAKQSGGSRLCAIM